MPPGRGSLLGPQHATLSAATQVAAALKNVLIEIGAAKGATRAKPIKV
jgi:hypothetical protein